MDEKPMAEVNMPKLSDTMEEGTVLEWKKKDGDEVHKGDVLAEVESDKATFDLEAEADGVLKIIVPNGVPAKIGAPIASIGARMPRRLRSRSTSAHDSVDSRNPSPTATSSLCPSARTPSSTRQHSRSSSRRMLKWTPSAHR